MYNCTKSHLYVDRYHVQKYEVVIHALRPAATSLMLHDVPGALLENSSAAAASNVVRPLDVYDTISYVRIIVARRPSFRVLLLLDGTVILLCCASIFVVLSISNCFTHSQVHLGKPGATAVHP